MDYKQTLNLPKTDFPMKANLPQREPDILEKWRRQDIYRLILENSKKSSSFILHDGPPYANGNIHIGHALNKILKDIVNKYKTLRGFSTPYIPGWDCHGLPVEHQLFKKLKKHKGQVNQIEFRERAHEFAMEFVEIQKEEFKRLGIFGDWDNPYLTLSATYEASIIRSFGKLVDKKFIYRGCKPVNWCCVCETALAEAEVEYEEHTSPSIYVKFKLMDTAGISSLSLVDAANCFLVIWTTTPWTLLGNVACAVHPEFDYNIVEIGRKDALILEKNLTATVLEQVGIKDYKILGEIKGRDLENLKYRHPFLRREGTVVLADYVSCEDGSGIVHTAPGYGAEDFITGKKYGLEILMQVDEKGCFYKDIPEVAGLNVKESNKRVMEILQENKALLFINEVQHSYPHCWRCKKPIIFRATEQWFMNIDHKDLRGTLLVLIKQTSWVPAFGEGRIAGMVQKRPDWCLSRQRLWGVPIPVFYCKNCSTPVLDNAVIENFARIVEKEGTNSWFIRTSGELLPLGYKCPKCKGKEFEKEMDILDVWFDSGVSHQAVLKDSEILSYPADLYLEGSDQHRGWFQAALITAAAIDGTAPFRQVLTHGFVVDGEGKKMSKSKGNVIAPQEVIDKLGADVLRLAIASADYNDDVRMSEEILSRVSESYRKIRNTLKFILGNLYDFDPENDALAYNQLMEIDKWALSALNKLLKQVTASYDKFIFHQAIKLIYKFCTIEMSSFYLDVLKDRLYTFGKNSPSRRSAQTVLYQILLTLTKITAPILAFTAEEAFSFSPKNNSQTIFLTGWPQPNDTFINEKLDKNWQALFELRNCVLKVLEEARSAKIIGNSLEAKVIIFYNRADKPLQELLNTYQDNLTSIFIVSQASGNSDVDSVNLPVYNMMNLGPDEAEGGSQIKIKVERAEGEKCIRCWNYSRAIGQNQNYPHICPRCIENINL
ncbi:MAG: isoleucine--tRNA ligase [Candidatus Omnitrophica bacterium]|nr:isoleucine--tRNA ligase [Candidatus Omnitrophota bacterium]